MSSRRQGGYHRSRSRAGLDRALQHIKEAEEFSKEIGGSDQDVKKYFFSLRGEDLRQVLDEYQSLYGHKARVYAEETMLLWRLGRRRMSGQTAVRLFKLLPKRMPREQKYVMVENIWKEHAPRSAFTICFGAHSGAAYIGAVLNEHLVRTVTEHTIPEPLRRRFEWLSDGDSVCLQEMLNYFLLKDRALAVEVVTAQVGIVLRNLAAGGGVATAFSRELKVGGHTVHVVLDGDGSEVTVRQGDPSVTRGGDRFGCLLALLTLSLVPVLGVALVLRSIAQ